MSTFEISVSCNGKFLFRVEEQSTYPDDGAMEVLSNLMVERFPASEGFEVFRVIWPSRLGDLKNLSEATTIHGSCKAVSGDIAGR